MNLKDEKALIELKTIFIELEHDLKMKELEFIRETERLRHVWAVERQNAKNEAIRQNLGIK